MFILLTPSLTDSAISLSGLADPPCSTKGISVASLIFFRISSCNSGFTSLGYIPCAVPIATARVSTPVLVTKSLACSGSVYVISLTPPSTEFPVCPIVPSSPSTETPAA